MIERRRRRALDETREPDALAPVRVLVDSGPLIALFNGRDAWHETVLSWLRTNPTTKLVGTWPVMTEVCALLSSRVRREAALDFLRWVDRGALLLDVPEGGSLREMLKASERYVDLPLDLADASVAEAAARLRIDCVLSLDRDFSVYRDRSGRALRNLLLEG